MNPTGKMMRLMMLLLFLVSIFPVGAGMLYAQEGTRELVDGVPLTGTLDAVTFAQTYWFEGIAGQDVTLFASTSDEGLDLAMLLTDADGNPLAQDGDPETIGAASIANYVLEDAGRYYATVLRLAGAEGDSAGEFSLTFVVDDGEQVEATTAPAVGPTLVTLDSGIQIAVNWNSTADIDLEVRDPFGNSIYWENPTADGGVYDRNVNANCVATTADNPTESVNWAPGAVPVGSYEIIVYYITGCDDNAPVNLNLSLTVNGTSFATVAGTLLPGQEFLSSFDLSASAQVTTQLSGVNPGDVLGDPTVYLTGQTPLASDDTVTGQISADNIIDAYSFTGKAGDIVTVRMDATAGNLDAKLFLLDANGNVVAVNDDAINASTTNAEVLNQTLVSDGLYTVLATRYGQEYGGTAGPYNLTLTGGDFAVPPALAGLNLPAGSVEVSLLWNTNADLQLLVRDPSGNAVYDDSQQINSGGLLAEDGNVNCANTTTSPVSYIYWPPDRLPPGTYEVEVWYQNGCNDPSPVTFNLTVRVNDQVVVAATRQPVQGQVFLTNFTVDVNGFASAGSGGFIGDSSMLDVGSALVSAIPVSYGDTVSGTINQANKYILYTFEGEAGDQVRVGMDATAGTLDTTLFLLSPDGAQLAVNDDAVVNETTNSLIDAFTLPADGTYIVVATHYGLLYGGTSGTYNLSIVQLN
jgi:hypothetical protein